MSRTVNISNRKVVKEAQGDAWISDLGLFLVQWLPFLKAALLVTRMVRKDRALG